MVCVRTSADLATMAGHNTTQSIYHPLSRQQRNERNMRDAGMFLLHIVTVAQQTLVIVMVTCFAAVCANVHVTL